MIDPGLAILGLWLVWILYWLVSAPGVKRNVRRRGGGSPGNPWAKGATARIIFALVVVFLFIIIQPTVVAWQIPGYGGRGGAASSPALQLVGTALVAAGIALAIWARRHLGRNWSAVPSIKEGHELVTSGPYRFVRHPIYTGLLFAVFGSALAGGVFWFIVFAYVTVIFVVRVKVEEQFMMELFPGEYPEYRKRTKALVPEVW